MQNCSSNLSTGGTNGNAKYHEYSREYSSRDDSNESNSRVYSFVNNLLTSLIPMVALAATALYVALYEWRTGEQQIAEFSTNSYLDVYLGHVNTLELIQEKRSSAFRSMMADIYSQASTVTDAGVYLGAPVADLDIDDLEE
ncbi:hypothetical protein EDB89DRAFT_2070537 [Lactarius sanguifluus]|nr:hypothetical protein EDB89DRAFT_2070537 [Lactarius sanguifluus]